MGDEVNLFATITGTGRNSIRIKVEAWRRNRTGDDVSKVTQATLTFIAIDESRRSRPLPEPECDSLATSAVTSPPIVQNPVSEPR